MTENPSHITEVTSRFSKQCSWPKYFLYLSIIALSYILAGKLGLMFTFPSVYATAIWPASGIALASILIFGYRAWPAILVGAYFTNFSATLDPTSAATTNLSFIIPLVISSGAALQAVVAAYLVRRLAGFPNDLANTREVVSFLFLGGLIGCLLNASISVSTLYLTGYITASELLINWFTWWAGDSMGVFIFTPLILVWFQHPKDSWHERQMTLTIPVIATFILTIALVTYGTRWEKERIQFLFDEHVSLQTNVLQKSLQGINEILLGLQSFHAASYQIEREEFRIFALNQLRAHPNVQALSWNPVIKANERNRFEQQIRQEGFTDFKIVEHTQDNQLVRAAERSEYVVVNFIEPQKDNQSAIGFDINSNPVRRSALEQARDSGKAVVTSRIKLLQGSNKQYGVLILMPVYDRKMLQETVTLRRQTIKGFMVAVLQLKNAVLDAMLDDDHEGLVHRLYDDTADAENAVLFMDEHILNEGRLVLHGDRLIPGSIIFRSEVAIPFAERQWRFEVLAGKKFIALHRSENTWLILASSLVLTSLLGAFVLVVSGRDNQLRSLVSKRNIDLQQSQQNLQEAQRIAHIGSWYLDIFSNQVAYSEELYHIYGFDPDLPLPGYEEHEKLFTAKSWGRLNDSIEQLKNDGRPYELELERVLGNGQKGWMWSRGEAVLDEHGELIGIRGVAQDITQNKLAKQELELQTFQLGERIKELSCLHKVTLLLQEYGPIDEVLQVLVNYLPPALQYPEHCCASIMYQGKFYFSENFGGSSWCLAAPIKISGEQVGSVRVFYTEDKPIMDEGPFLREERELIDNIALLIQQYVQKKIDEAALAKFEEDIKESQRIAHIGRWKWTIENDQMVWSEEIFNIFGVNQNDPPPSFAEHQRLFTPSSWENLNYALEITRKNGDPFETELEIVRQQGAGWLWFRGEAVNNENDEVVAIRGVVQDISERKSAQLALIESESHYRKLFTESSIVMLLVDPTDGSIKEANNAAMEFYGYPSSQLRKMNINEINTLPQEQVQAEMTQAKDQGRQYFEFRHILANGQIRDVQVSSGPIVIDGKILLMSTILDVTERKNAEQALRNSEKTMRDLFMKAPLAYQSLDMQGNIVEVNDLWLEQMGYQRDEVIGRFIGEFIENDSISILECEFPKFQQKGKVEGPIFEMMRKDQSRFLWEVNGRIGKNAQGESVRTHCMLTDVSARESAKQALIDSEARLRSYIDNAPIAVFVADEQGCYINTNSAATELVGYSREELCGGMSIRDLAEQQDIEKHMQEFKQVLKAKRGTVEITLRHKLGDLIMVSITANLLPEGHVIGFVSDITMRKQDEARMREALVVFNASSQGIMTTDADGFITAVNPAFTTITGYSAEEVIGLSPSILRSDRHDAEFFKSMWQTIEEKGKWEGEIWNRRHNGQVYPQWQTISKVLDTDGQVVEYVALFSDITERKQQEEEIWHQANFDALTGLANRNLLVDRLQRALAQAKRNDNKVGLVFLDLDGFKWINDTLGHDVGDELLIEVAQRINSTVRDQDTAARLGGDEFTVVIHDLKDMESLRAVGEKLVGILHDPFTLEGSTHQISGSVGITVYPDDGEDVQTLLKNADIAMYKAKQAGKNRYQFYSRHMQIDTQARMQMEADLRIAISEQQFLLHYQPIVDGDSGELLGAEALIRWQHPERGLISPLDFIPVAEDSGLIIPIGEWVLREAAKQWSIWHQKGHPPLRMSVNISSPQFREENLEQLIVDVLREYNVEPGYLVLEITESVLMDGSSEAEARMRKIKELGISYALDDFGTGFSSLSYLKRFPVDIVKIDRSFINDCPEDHNDAHLVEAIVSMAHSLDLQVTAEGVETEEQFEFLRELGCDYMQGYLVSRPLPAETFEVLIERTLLLLPTDGASMEETRFLAALRQDFLDVEQWLQRLLNERKKYQKEYKAVSNWTMRGMDLRQAVTVHLQWRRRLDDFISTNTDESAFSVEDAGSCELCTLGKWIAKNRDMDKKCLKQLEKAHRAFHRLAGQIVDDHLNGHRTMARRALMGIAFRKASREVVTALIACYQKENQKMLKSEDKAVS